MALIRKEQAGSDSFGHTWDADGAVVEIDDGEQIASLMAIPDGGFSEVTPTAGDSGDDGDADDSGGDPGKTPEFAEVDPKDDDATPAPAKKTAARKTAATKPQE